jgi:hypothetical protein
MFAPPAMVPGPAFAPPARTAPAAVAVPARTTPATVAVPARTPESRQPVVRAQAPEEPKPPRPPLLTLPPPEQLGVAVRPVENAAADWTALHARMKELGVQSFQMDKLADGRARFTCWLPLDRPGMTRRIECEAASALEAMQRGLREAEQTPRATP